MAVSSFDGPNLTITFLSGLTEIEVQDVYEDWKDWIKLSDNSKYIPAFRPDGGSPLTSIINQGSYFFLNNLEGWRIKPPEEDITIYLVGNLAVEDTTLPAFVPTTGAFTAAILGLQPVTQGVTPAMASQLQFNVFQGLVCVDQANGVAGTGLAANGLDPIGSRKAPSSNMADALTIAVANGLNVFNFMSNGTITTGDFSAGYIFRADNVKTTVSISPAANVSGCSVTHCALDGELDGLNLIKEAEVHDVTDVNGEISRCDLDGTISINGTMHLYSCYSGIAASGAPTVDEIGANQLIVREMRGSLAVGGMTGGDHSIGIYGGRLIVNADCTGGTIYLRGDPYEITDLSGGAVTIMDQTDSQKVSEIHRRLGLDTTAPLTNKENGGITATGIDIVATQSGSDIIQTRQ